jgi:gliding motility-associated lipoprotein GldB
MKVNYLILSFFLLAFFSCKKEKKVVDTSHISFDITLNRFDQEYSAVDAQHFKDLKAKYPYLFPGDIADSTWINRKNDSLFQVLNKEVQKTFIDFRKEKKQIEEVFKRVKYYYPKIKEPKMITLISNLDLDNQIIFTDSLLLVSLDTYLGKDKIYYSNYPSYLRSNFDKNHLSIDVAQAITNKIILHIPYRLFVERILAAGKTKYAMHQFLPDKSDAEIMGYSETKIKWAEQDEERIWSYFVEKEYLYNTDKDLQRRFIEPAPFSKFYLESDNQSPGQIGTWLGYRIVSAFMENNKVSLPDMLAMPPIDIFNKSKYKPKK